MTGSHAQWAEGYAAASGQRVSLVGLDAGPWRWRLRAGAAPLADGVRAHIEAYGTPDVLLVSGLVDAAQLMGYLRRSIPSATALVVYQHESQLVYPTASGAPDQESSLRNWSTWLAADLVLFNSEYHRHAVQEALPVFLGRQPDNDQAQFLDEVVAKFEVVPVGVDLVSAGDRRTVTQSQPPVILWPHRWEPDKDPHAFVRALAKLDERGQDFRLVLAGVDPVVPSPAKQLLLDRWGGQVLAAGPFSIGEYRRLLRCCDVVVSCAKHEFFGVAVVEAISAGCVPVLPDALAYPELIADEWKEFSTYPPGRFGSRLSQVVADLDSFRDNTVGLGGSMARFGWGRIAPQLDDRLISCWQEVQVKG